MLQALVTGASNMLLVGVGDQELASHLADFSIQLLQVGEFLFCNPVTFVLVFWVTVSISLIQGAETTSTSIWQNTRQRPGLLCPECLFTGGPGAQQIILSLEQKCVLLNAILE